MGKSVFIVGRNPSCHTGEIPIIINDPTTTVSSTHCRITVENKNIYIEDLNSVNGTFVNGSRISQSMMIDKNSTIMLGKRVQFYLSHPSIQNIMYSDAENKNDLVEKIDKPIGVNQNIGDRSKNEHVIYSNYEYASFGQRLGGYLLDNFILSLFIVPLYLIFMVITSFSFNATAAIFAVIILIVFMLVLIHMYFVAPISKKGHTIGRKAAGITYLDVKTMSYPSASSVWLRFFCYGLSGTFFMLGYLMATWDSKHQALHDKIAGTIVIKSK